jgi:cytochrome P450
VGIPHWATSHTKSNFTDPDIFVPERWLPNPEERYSKDNHEVFKPFGMGSGDCIGKQ